MEKQSFLEGAFILILASFLVKALGFLYQILIVRLIGTEGIGIFNMIYPLYITAMVITTMGLPLAISKFVAEETAHHGEVAAEKILGMSITCLLVIGTVGGFILLFISPKIILHFYTDPRIIPSFLLLIPTLLLVSISSAIRGFFQGLQDMRPTALTQLIEQVIRFFTGLILVYLLYPYGLTWAAVGLALGILLSELGGLIYLWNIYKKSSSSGKIYLRPSLSILRKLFAFGIPITITRLVSTFVAAIEASIIPKQLMAAGKTLSQATSFYGELTGVALTLLTIPSTLTFSLATTLVPAISEAQSKHQSRLMGQRTSDALGVTLLAGVPCAIILFYWGTPLSSLIFNVQDAGYILKILALGSVFLYIAQTTSGILQGIGYVKLIFTTTLLSSLIRISGILYLGGNPDIGIIGIPISYVAGFITLALLNLLIIKRKTGLTFPVGSFLRLLVAGFLLRLILIHTTYLIEDNLLLLIILTLIYVFGFFLFLLVTGDRYVRLILWQISMIKKP